MRLAPTPVRGGLVRAGPAPFRNTREGKKLVTPLARINICFERAGRISKNFAYIEIPDNCALDILLRGACQQKNCIFAEKTNFLPLPTLYPVTIPAFIAGRGTLESRPLNLKIPLNIGIFKLYQVGLGGIVNFSVAKMLCYIYMKQFHRTLRPADCLLYRQQPHKP